MSVRRHLLHVTVLALAALVLGSGLTAASSQLQMKDLVRLVEAGVGDEVIRRQVEVTGTRFELNVDEIILLRDAGAGDDLITFLQETQWWQPTGADETRVYRKATDSGTGAIVLTNLDEDGRRLGQDVSGSIQGVISSSERHAQRYYKAELPPQQQPTTGTSLPLNAVLPSSIEITVRQEGDGDRALLEQVAQRLDQLETGPGEPQVGDWLPYFQPWPENAPFYGVGYPGIGYGFGGLPLTFVGQPQPFKVHKYGPFLSFTGANHAGFDPYKPVSACVPGQACSVQQRLHGSRVHGLNRASHQPHRGGGHR